MSERAVSPPRDRALRFALLALAVVALAPIAWGAHQPFSWDADNIAPGSVLKGLVRGFGPGWYSSYGPLPYYLVGLAYVPALLVFRLTGELGTGVPEYPWGFAHPELSVFALILIARLVSAALAGLAVWTLVRDALPGEARTRRWIVPVLLAGSPVFAYYARTSNVDMHFFAWLALGFHLVERPRAGRLALSAAAAAAVAAVCSKEQAAPLAAAIVVRALWRALRSDRSGAAAAATVAAAALATYAVAWMLPLNLEGWRAHHHFILHVARYPRTYPLTPDGMLGLGRRLAELLPVALGWPVIAGLVLALGFRPALTGLGTRLAGAALYLLGFIGPVGYIYPRFLLPVLLLAVPLAARSLERAFEAGSVRPGLRALLAAGLLWLAISGGPNLAAVQLTDARYAVSRWIERLPADVTLEIAGNPRFQAPAPRGRRAIYTSLDSLLAAPRAPRGDVVLLSSLDEAFFRRNPRARAAWWDSLASADGPYRPALWFRPPRPTGNVSGLFVSPTVQAYVRRDVPLAPTLIR